MTRAAALIAVFAAGVSVGWRVGRALLCDDRDSIKADMRKMLAQFAAHYDRCETAPVPTWLPAVSDREAVS